ncbi:hypothetical protein NKH89_35070 [Mesorhizobium sp. M0923]|uniref:hypothetical protein n=1 Tax=Mesorhizobium sp. M0923 TaxID=2957028 RepID=UPI00333A82B6
MLKFKAALIRSRKYDQGRVSAKGSGMMRGIDLKFGEVAGQVISTAFQNGLVLEAAGPKDEVVKCLPPLVIGEDQLSQGLDILADAIESVIGSTVNGRADHDRQRCQ